jgi:hypothetical protein
VILRHAVVAESVAVVLAVANEALPVGPARWDVLNPPCRLAAVVVQVPGVRTGSGKEFLGVRGLRQVSDYLIYAWESVILRQHHPRNALSSKRRLVPCILEIRNIGVFFWPLLPGRRRAIGNDSIAPTAVVVHILARYKRRSRGTTHRHMGVHAREGRAFVHEQALHRRHE